MSEDFNGKVGARMAEVEKEFKQLEAERVKLVQDRNGLTGQVSTIDRRLNEIQVGQISLQGRYAELQTLAGKPKDKPELKTPSDKKKKAN